MIIRVPIFERFFFFQLPSEASDEEWKQDKSYLGKGRKLHSLEQKGHYVEHLSNQQQRLSETSRYLKVAFNWGSLKKFLLSSRCCYNISIGMILLKHEKKMMENSNANKRNATSAYRIQNFIVNKFERFHFNNYQFDSEFPFHYMSITILVWSGLVYLFWSIKVLEV